jgi:hypothetical protein
LPPRPQSTVGPGRRLFGQWGPGLPGPGQPPTQVR